jgi:WS/DGAT/MGAT family acyltransferase
MKPLAGQDAAFLYLETPEMPMHIASLTLFAPSGLSPAEIYRAFRDHTQARLDVLPHYRRRLCPMPLALDHPVWVDDDAVDLAYHIKRRALPSPGKTAQLYEAIGDLHAQQLNRLKPLWQCHVIEGLADGGFAIYMKLHHAAMDGVAAMLTLPSTFDFLPGLAGGPIPPHPRHRHENDPGLGRMLATAIGDFVQQDVRLVAAMPKLAVSAYKVGRRAASTMRLLPSAFKRAPQTPLNVPIGQERIFVTLTLPLAEAKSLGKARGATMNDIVMAVCAGGLRRYLAARKALPDEPLIAAVPVSLRGPGETTLNNQTGIILCDLATHLADPLERLAAISASARDARARFLDIKEIFPTELSVPGAPLLAAGITGAAKRLHVFDMLPPFFNVLISNVPGPRQPMYCANAAATHHFPVSIPLHRCALNITVLSYVDNIDFGLIACRAALPDVQSIADGIAAEFTDLKQAAASIAARGSINSLELVTPLLIEEGSKGFFLKKRTKKLLST